MSHLLASVNPDAAQRVDHPVALPALGSNVLYVPRPSEMKARMKEVPAIVYRRDEDNQRLDLLVLFDRDEFGVIESLPYAVGEERGWRPVESGDALALGKLAAFKEEIGLALFGKYERPETSLLDLIEDVRARVAKLEAGSAGQTDGAKRGRRG